MEKCTEYNSQFEILKSSFDGKISLKISKLISKSKK